MINTHTYIYTHILNKRENDVVAKLHISFPSHTKHTREKHNIFFLLYSIIIKM